MLPPPADEDVEIAEPNFMRQPLQAQPNDEYLSLLWGMLGSSAGGANAAGAWGKGYTNCSDVVIAVIGEPSACCTISD